MRSSRSIVYLIDAIQAFCMLQRFLRKQNDWRRNDKRDWKHHRKIRKNSRRHVESHCRRAHRRDHGQDQEDIQKPILQIHLIHAKQQQHQHQHQRQVINEDTSTNPPLPDPTQQRS